MNSTFPVERDERTLAVENASYRWAYTFVCFGLLMIIAFRSFARHESSWDLFALIILSGCVKLAFQGSKKVLSRQWAIASLITMVVAAVLAALLVLIRR